MNKATEKQLSLLHGKVAESMSAALDQSSMAVYLIDKYGNDLPDKVLSFLNDCSNVNPSLLTAITKFLKDNNISVDIEGNDALSGLEESLARKKATVTSIPLED